MDTTNEIVSVRLAGAKKRLWSVEERRKIVEATLQSGASVSRVARCHDVNANQVFHWRKLYREGRLGSSTSTKFLPVKVTDERSVREAEGDGIAWRSGTVEIQLPKGTLRVAGAVNVAALRAAAIYSLTGSAKLNGTDPEAYLRDVLPASPIIPSTSSRNCYRGTSSQAFLPQYAKRHKQRHRRESRRRKRFLGITPHCGTD